MLDKRGVKHQVLNAKHHKREAEIIAQAGRLGAVTIATNMAGRGTDIVLGGNPETMAWARLQDTYPTRLDVPRDEWDNLVREIQREQNMMAEGDLVKSIGGLHVIGTERHDARRIDLQLRGRCGRQGDPGSSRFYLSLEDDLMRIFAGEWVRKILESLGMKEGEAIESRMVTRRIEAAQKKVEERHFEGRKHLLEYDEVMDEQRKRVYGYRQRILDGANCRDLILEASAARSIIIWASTCNGTSASNRSASGQENGWRSTWSRGISAGWISSRPSRMPATKPSGSRKLRCWTPSKRICRIAEDEESPEEWNWLALTKFAIPAGD
jgi:preprotein translocase subunit SecA